MRQRFKKSRAGRLVLGAVVVAAMGGLGATSAHATLTLDLEAPGGTPNSPLKTYTPTGSGPISLNVYADITDGANSGVSGDQLGGLFAAFDAAGSGGASGTLTSSLSSDFNQIPPGAAQAGGTYNYTDTAGNVHNGIGNLVSGTTSTSPAYDSSTSDNWFFPLYLNNTGGNINVFDPNGSPLTAGGVNGAYFLVGTLSLDPGSSSSGSITVTPTVRDQTATSSPTAVWKENGVVVAPNLATSIGSYVAGTGVTINFGSGPIQNPGDVNGDGVVNTLDLNIIVGNWQKTGETFSQGDLNDDGVVNTLDLNQVIGNWQKTYSASVIAVPEPTSLCLLGLGGLAVLRRRRSR